MNTSINDQAVIDNIDDCQLSIEEYDVSKRDHHINNKTMRKNPYYRNLHPVLQINRPKFGYYDPRKTLKYYTEIDDDIALLLAEDKLYQNYGEFSLKSSQDEIIELLEKNFARKSISVEYNGSTITSYYVKPNMVYQDIELNNYDLRYSASDIDSKRVFKGKTFDTNYIYSELFTKICPVYIPCPDGYSQINTRLQCSNKKTLSVGTGINHSRSLIDQSIRVEKGSEIIIKLNELQNFTHIGTVGSYPSVYSLKRFIMHLPNGKLRLSKKKNTNILIKDSDVLTSWCKEYNLYYRNEMNKKYVHIGKFNGNLSDHDFKMNDLRQHIQYIETPIRYLKLVPIMEPDCTEIRMSIGLYKLSNKFAYDEDILEKIDTSDPSYFVKYDIISSDTRYVHDKKHKKYDIYYSKNIGEEKRRQNKREIDIMINEIINYRSNLDLDT